MGRRREMGALPETACLRVKGRCNLLDETVTKVTKGKLVIDGY